MQEKGENQQKQTHGIHVCIMAFSFATLALLLQEQTSVVGILGLDSLGRGLDCSPYSGFLFSTQVILFQNQSLKRLSGWTAAHIQGFCFPHR